MKTIITLFALSAASLCAAPAVQSNMMNNGTPGNVNPNTNTDSLYNNTSNTIRNNTANRNSPTSSTQDFRNNPTDIRNSQTPDSMRNLNQDSNSMRNPNNSAPYSRNGNGSPRTNTSARNDSNNPSRDPAYTAEIELQMEKAQVNTKYPQDTGATFKDQEINKKIRNKIEGWFADDYKDVILKTDNGVVTLSGDVETEELSRDLADQVRKVDGVTSVTNNVKAKVVNTKAAPVVTPATTR